MCITEAAVIVDKTFSKQVSRKSMITSKTNRKWLKKVQVTTDYKKSLMNLIELKPIQKTESKPKKLTPVKIYSCEKCPEKFTTRDRLNFHYDHLHQLESEESSGSEKELVIDEDVELVLEEEDRKTNAVKDRRIKKEPLDTVRIYPRE